MCGMEREEFSPAASRAAWTERFCFQPICAFWMSSIRAITSIRVGRINCPLGQQASPLMLDKLCGMISDSDRA